MRRICAALTLAALALVLCACGHSTRETGGNLSVAVEAEGVYSIGIGWSAQLQSDIGSYADNSVLTGGHLDFDLSEGRRSYTVSALDGQGRTLASGEFEDDFSSGDVAYLVVTPDLEIIRAEATPEGLTLMQRRETEAYTAVLWEGRTYIPFCAVDNDSRGKQLGIVNGNERDQIYEYRGYDPEEWIISFYRSGLMDGSLLLRESGVTEIPDGLTSEYEWNQT